MNKSEAGKLGKKKSEEARKRNYLQRIATYNENPVTCSTCKKSLPYEKKYNKYCSKSCSAISLNSSKNHNKKSLPCKECGELAFSQNLYCEQCIRDKKHLRTIEKTELAKCDKVRRRILLKRRGDKCEECGLSEWRDIKISVQVHHIDGNSDNNFEDNLKLLCPNCHSITPNFGRKNLGKGRAIRRERYALGKSR